MDALRTAFFSEPMKLANDEWGPYAIMYLSNGVFSYEAIDYCDSSAIMIALSVERMLSTLVTEDGLHFKPSVTVDTICTTLACVLVTLDTYIQRENGIANQDLIEYATDLRDRILSVMPV